MTRKIHMPERGRFVVDDDPECVIATALAIATDPLNAPLRHRLLAPGGAGYDAENGWIARIGSGDEDQDDAPEDTWTLCRLPNAKWVLDGTTLRELVEHAFALRLAVPRTVTMDPWGSFTVTDDERGVLGTALAVATAPQHRDIVETAFRPGGSGLRVEAIGSVSPVHPEEQLEYPFDEEPALDPSIQELWRVFRDRDRVHGNPSKLIITGAELRALVKQALALREGFRSSPLV